MTENHRPRREGARTTVNPGPYGGAVPPEPSITAAAQAEADARWPASHLVDDPFGETGWAYSDEYGYDETANKAFVQGAEWAANQLLQQGDERAVRTVDAISQVTRVSHADVIEILRAIKAPREITDAMVEAAQDAFHEFVCGNEEPLTRRQRGITRLAYRRALEAAEEAR